MGAPEGNQNRTTHGRYASGKLPAGCSYLRRELNRRHKEWLEAVQALHPGVAINSSEFSFIGHALEAEKQRRLLARQLRLETSPSAETLLSLTNAMLRASEARCKALERLGLKPATDSADGWDAYYQQEEGQQ